MHIAIDLQACQTASRSRGIGRYALSMARALLRQGAGRHVFTIVLNDRFLAEAEAVRDALDDLVEPKRIVTLSLPDRISIKAPANAWRADAAEAAYELALRDLGVEAIFCPSLFEGVKDDVVTPGGRPGLPLFATVHDLIPFENPDAYLGDENERRAYFRQIETFRRAEGLFAVSAFTGRQTERLVSIPTEQIVHAPLGAADVFAPFSGTAAERQTILDRYGVKGRFVIVTTPYEERKNVFGLLAGYSAIAPALRADLQLVIAGFIRPDGQAAILKAAREDGLGPDEVILAGYVPDPDLAALYSFCELMVFPSLSEGFGLPPLEAMACGAAVVASNTTSIPEVVTRPDAQFDPTNVIEMGEAIERPLKDPAFRHRLQVWGRKHARTFSWDRSADTILQTIEARLVSTSRKLAPVSTIGAARRSVGLVIASGARESRQNGVALSLLRDLAARYDVVACLLGDELPDAGIWSRVERRSSLWFEEDAGDLDAVIYAFESSRLHEAARWQTARPGAVIVLDDDGSPVIRGGNQTIPAEIQTSLFAQGGFSDVLDFMSADDIGNYRPGGALKLSTAPIAASDVGALANLPGLRQTPRRTVGVDLEAGAQLRRQHGIPAKAPLVLCWTESRDEAAKVVQGFRAARREDAWLIVGFDDEGDNILAVGEAPDRLGSAPGNIVRVGSDLRRRYLPMFSAADLILSFGDEEGLARDLLIDAGATGKSVILAGARPNGRAQKALAATLRKALELETGGTATTTSRRNTETAQAERSALQAGLIQLVDAAPDPRLRPDLIDRLKPMVQGVGPTEDDLTQLVQKIAANATLTRAPRLFFDVSGLASRNPRYRMDLTSRRLLTSLLRAGGDGIEFVYFDGTRYVLARQFTGLFLGIRNPALSDEVAVFRAGDRLAGLDLIGGFTTDAARALAEMRARGVGLFSSVTAKILARHPEVAAAVGSAVYEAAVGLSPPSGSVSGSTARSGADATATHPAANVRVIDLNTDEAIRDLATTLRGSVDRRTARGASVTALSRLLARKPRKSVAANANYTILGHILGTYSLAIVNRALAQTLEKALPGRVAFAPYETAPVTDFSKIPPDEAGVRDLVDKRLPSGNLDVVISQHYPLMPPPGRPDIAMALFAWEETHVPRDTVDVLNAGFDVVLAQVRSVQKAMIDSGVYRPLPLTGLPANVDPYLNLEKRLAPGIKTFLHVSSCFPRKGVDVLLEAWGEAFTDADPVRLLIKTFPNIHNDIEDQIRRLKARHPRCAEIVVVNADVDKAELASLYAQADAMVLPTRGEGYNLPAIEAMVAGLPLIVTGFGGHRDFCGPDEARLLEYRFERSGSHVRKGVSLWVEPDRADLVAALREQTDPAFAQQIEARRLAARESALAAIDPDAWVRRLQSIVQSLRETPPAEPPRTGWVTTWQVQCGIAQYSSFILEQLPDATRDVTRILSDSRTGPGRVGGIDHEPAWTIGRPEKVSQLGQAIEAQALDAVVIQHQDGLITWPDLALILNDPRFYERIGIITLHIAGNLRRLPDWELQPVLDGLRRCARVLVHTVPDLNLLKSYGLIDNVTLLPHGAIAPRFAPRVRPLPSNSAPLIGCHGFFFSHKGIDKLIRAAAVLRQEWPGLRVRLVNARFPGGASDGAIAMARAVAEEVGMTDAIDWRLDFLPVDEINSLLAECDVLALPYDESEDSASGAVRVAMTSLSPLVVSDVKIFAEIDDAVVKVGGGTPEAFADAIADLLRSAERRLEVQQSMQAWLEAHDWKRIAATMDGMIKGLADAQRRNWHL